MVQNVNLSDSVHNFSSRSVDLYGQLSQPTKSIIDLMKNVASSIISNDEIINEDIDISHEGDEIWYSYTIETNTYPCDSLALNKTFISYCIDNGLHDLLNSNVTFRFKIGKRNADKCTKSFDHFKGFIK